VVSLFTRVAIKKALQLPNYCVEEDILRFFGHVLTSSFFSFGGQFYEQTNGAATGSQIFPSGD
jgi:hypothetical protein